MCKKLAYIFIFLLSFSISLANESKPYIYFNPSPNQVDIYFLDRKPREYCFVPRNKEEYDLILSSKIDKKRLKKKLPRCTRIETFTWDDSEAGSNQRAVMALNQWIQHLKSQNGKVVWEHVGGWAGQTVMGITHKNRYYFVKFNVNAGVSDLVIHSSK